MTERERILEKIKRVQALAERGVAGERDSAAATLDRLMKQYGITEDDIANANRTEVDFASDLFCDRARGL